MRAKQNGHGIAFCRWLVAGALACLSLTPAWAAKKVDFTQLGATHSGNKASFGMTGQDQNWGSAVPINKPVGGGWGYAGNYGFPTPATGPTMTLGGNGDVYFAGTKYPFQAAFDVPKANLFGAALGLVGGLAGGPLGLALAGLPLLLDFFGPDIEPNPAGTNPGNAWRVKDPESCSGTCTQYSIEGGADGSKWSFSKNGACNIFFNSPQFTITNPNDGSFTQEASDPMCKITWRNSEGGQASPSNYGYVTRQVLGTGVNWLPLSMADIEPYLSARNPNSELLPQLLDKGASVQMPAPTITGPSHVDTPTTTVDNGDGTRTETKTRKNFTTSGNTVTNSSNVTTSTTINNSTNTVINTTTKTEVKDDTQKTPEQEKQEEDPCKANPDRVGCAELDTPEDEVPKREANVIFTAEDLGLGSGSCPAAFPVNTSQGNYSLNLQPYCNMIEGVFKPLLLAFAALGAMMICMQGIKGAD